MDELYRAFDRLVVQFDLEKVRTAGEAYLAAGGLSNPMPDHAAAVAELALAMQRDAARISVERGRPFRLRVGISNGPVVAGVVGRTGMTYDLFGEAVERANTLGAACRPGGVLLCSGVREALGGRYQLEEAEPVMVDKELELDTCYLASELPEA